MLWWKRKNNLTEQNQIDQDHKIESDQRKTALVFAKNPNVCQENMRQCSCDSHHAPVATAAPRMKPLHLQHWGQRGTHREIPTLGKGKEKQSDMHCPAPASPLKPSGAKHTNIIPDWCRRRLSHQCWTSLEEKDKKKKKTKWSCNT